MKRLLLLFLFLSVALPGCNILSWTHSGEQSHMDRGLELMSQGHYAEAEGAFALAMDENPTSADARYYHAKATLSGAHFDVVELLSELSQSQDDRTHDGASLPLYNKEIDSVDEMYRVNLTIVTDLRPIYDGETYGIITVEDIDYDLAIAYLIVALLGLRDTNRDSAITEEDLIFDISYSSSVAEYSIVGFHQFSGGGLKPRSLPVSVSGVNPEDINPFIDYVLNLIEESEDVLIATLQEWTTGLSDENIRALIDDVRTTIIKYYYDDDKDNDGDERVDEEQLNGHDDDNDGLTDEDTEHV